MMKIFDELASRDAREQRLFIYSRLPNDPAQITSDHLIIIDEVLSKMDMLWIMIDQKQLDAKYVFDAYGEIFIKLWTRIHPIVIYERNRRGDYYRKRAENLVSQTKKYFRKRNKPSEYSIYTQIEQANQPIKDDNIDKRSGAHQQPSSHTQKTNRSLKTAKR